MHEGRILLTYTDGWKMGIAELSKAGAVKRAVLLDPPLDARGCNPIGHRPVAGEFISEAREKNWALFTSEKKLYLLYWVQPSIIFEFDPRTWRFGAEYKLAQVLPGIPGEIHSASNAVSHAGLQWQIVHTAVRSVGRPIRYHCWMRAFDAKPPFETKVLTNIPVLSGSQEPGTPSPLCGHEVVFTTGLLRERGGWRIFFGENDLRIGMAVLSDEKLHRHLIRLPTKRPAH